MLIKETMSQTKEKNLIKIHILNYAIIDTGYPYTKSSNSLTFSFLFYNQSRPQYPLQLFSSKI